MDKTKYEISYVTIELRSKSKHAIEKIIKYLEKHSFIETTEIIITDCYKEDTV